jgi:hypothetical protein
VLFYIRNKFNPVEKKIKGKLEVLCVDIKVRYEKRRLVLVYRPPNQIETYDNNLYNKLTILVENNPFSIIMEDFNCRNIDWENMIANGEANILLEFKRNNYLIQRIDKCARNDGILDLIFTSLENIIND